MGNVCVICAVGTVKVWNHFFFVELLTLFKAPSIIFRALKKLGKQVKQYKNCNTMEKSCLILETELWEDIMRSCYA